MVNDTEIQSSPEERVRYDRQMLIWGPEGQQKLKDSTVAILGSGNLAKYTALPLAALGIGNIILIGDEKAEEGEMFLDKELEEGSKVPQIADMLSRINPFINVIGMSTPASSRTARNWLRESDVVISAENNLRTQAQALEHADYSGTSTIVSSVGGARGLSRSWVVGVPIDNSFMFPQLEGEKQDPATSLLFGAIAAEEAKKKILGEMPAYDRTIQYGHNSPDLKFENATPVWRNEVRDDKTILMVGAGALGNYMSLALPEMNVGKVVVLDKDVIENHNLNRQVLFYDGVGEKKSILISRKLNRMDPNIESRGIHDFFELEKGIWSIDEMEIIPDVVLDLVDNKYARALVSGYCVERSVPLISAASSAEASMAVAYKPGQTSCLDHVISGYYEQGLEEERERRQSCPQVANPSVSITNQAAAALAALQLNSLMQEDYGPQFNGLISFNTRNPFRLGNTPIAKACECHNDPSSIPNLEFPEEAYR